MEYHGEGRGKLQCVACMKVLEVNARNVIQIVSSVQMEKFCETKENI